MEGTVSSEEEEDAPVVAQMLGAFGDDPLLAAHVAHAKMLKYGSEHCEADAAKAAGLAAGAVVVAKGGGVAEAACEATLAAAVAHAPKRVAVSIGEAAAMSAAQTMGATEAEAVGWGKEARTMLMQLGLAPEAS